MRYLITGGSGYIGSRLTEMLAARDDVESIVDLDIRPPASPHAKSTFVRGDVRDYASIRALLEREQPDAVVHLAFVLNPIRDEARMYDIDVNGTAAVLRAAADAGTQQVLVTSSATAYGAFPDNPKPRRSFAPASSSAPTSTTTSHGPGRTRRSYRSWTASTRITNSSTRTTSSARSSACSTPRPAVPSMSRATGR